MFFTTITDYVQDFNEIELISVPIPEVRDGHILVKVLFAINDYKVILQNYFTIFKIFHIEFCFLRLLKDIS